MFKQVIPEGVTVVAAGAFHSMLIKRDGSIWATGSNRHGQFGDGTITYGAEFARLSLFDNVDDDDDDGKGQ